MDLLATTWFGPMFDDRASIFGLPVDLVYLVGVAALLAFGFLWVRHSLGPDELTRGDARWRYRDRGVRHAIADLVHDLRSRTGGWWATRIEFAVAIGSLGFVVLAVVWLPSFARSSSLLAAAPTAIGLVGIVIGLVAMVRIYRAGLREDAATSWRYRDRD